MADLIRLALAASAAAYLGWVRIAHAAGMPRDELAADVCSVVREAGRVLGVGK